MKFRMSQIDKIELSVDKVLNIAKTITTIRVNMPENREVYTRTLFLTEPQKTIEPLSWLTESQMK